MNASPAAAWIMVMKRVLEAHDPDLRKEVGPLTPAQAHTRICEKYGLERRRTATPEDLTRRLAAAMGVNVEDFVQ